MCATPPSRESLSDREFLRYGVKEHLGCFQRAAQLRKHTYCFASSLGRSVGSQPVQPCFLPALQIPLDTGQTWEAHGLWSTSQSQM